MDDQTKRPQCRLVQKWISFLAKIVFGILTALLVILNLRLYSPAAVTGDHTGTPIHAEAQLRWLRKDLEKGGGERMQLLFPEGWFFCHLFYGIAWIELALRKPGHVKQALEEARWSLARIESQQGKAPFAPELAPDHGMFYAAWLNHLLSGILLIQPENKRDQGELVRFEENCQAIAETLTHSPTPFPPSYPGQSWPCDTLPAIHSLCVREAMQHDGRYQEVISNWLAEAKKRLDPDTGLLPHTSHWQTGEPTSPARGTSQVIMLRILADIDRSWARSQYEIFRSRYFDTLAGIPAIREYPVGQEGPGDVDSGPLILGISGSATVVGLGVAGIFGDHGWAGAVSQAGEALGFPLGSKERCYLAGILPVGDAFWVQASSARPWLDQTAFKLEPLPYPTG